ncbi:6-phosphofructokinase [Candidatus Bipolaricaulota bacterium]|nr:6-phosphofructokinase [Candidatus Bipolaricaulota bacterium]
MSAAPSGNLLVAQSGGPTAVINNSLYGIIKESKKHPEINRIYGSLHGIEGVLEENIVDLNEESLENIEGLKEAPASALGSIRYKVTEDDYSKILSVFEKLNIRYFFYIGGNDSMDTADKVARLSRESGRDLRVIGVPKTVDNDLVETDHCPGYGSAARYTAITVREIGIDVESLPPPVTVYETMGRNSGWLTASTALARGDKYPAPNLIYCPERPLDKDRFLNDVQKTYDEMGYALIAVSEGLKDKDGNPISMAEDEVKSDDFGHALPGGVGSRLSDLISDELGLRARDEKPGLAARCSSQLASEADREEARRLGTEAVISAMDGLSGKMVALNRRDTERYQVEIVPVPLAKVANAEKKMPSEFINAAGNDVTKKFFEYARPLIGGKLPEYVKLEKKRING